MLGQIMIPYYDSMQCSEIFTVNKINDQIGCSNNELNETINYLSLEKLPEKRLKNNHSFAIANMQQTQRNREYYKNKKSELINNKEAEKHLTFHYLKQFDFMQFKYSNEDFTYQINAFCKKIASEKHASEVASKFPLFKMIRSIIKKFLFNEFEVIYFGCILEESKWKVDDIELRKHAYFMDDFLNITEVKDLLEYKSILLFLILTGYGVKFHLNEESEIRIFDSHINTIIKDFQTLYKYWTSVYGQISLKVIPKQLNRVFRNLSNRPSEFNNGKKQHQDYNSLVDAIIQISPPYNNERNYVDLSEEIQQSTSQLNMISQKQQIPNNLSSSKSASPLNNTPRIFNYTNHHYNNQKLASTFNIGHVKRQDNTREKKYVVHQLNQSKLKEFNRNFSQNEQTISFNKEFNDEDNNDHIYPNFGSILYMQPSLQSQESTIKFDQVSAQNKSSTKSNSVTQSSNSTGQFVFNNPQQINEGQTTKQHAQTAESFNRTGQQSPFEPNGAQYENLEYSSNLNNQFLTNNNNNFSYNNNFNFMNIGSQFNSTFPLFLQSTPQIDNNATDGQSHEIFKLELNRPADLIPDGNISTEQQQSKFVDSSSRQFEDYGIGRDIQLKDERLQNNQTSSEGMNCFNEQIKCELSENLLQVSQQAELGLLYPQFSSMSPSSINDQNGLLYQPNQLLQINNGYCHLKI